MTHIVLIRHAAPAIDPAKPAHAWPLSEPGRRAAADLAPAVRALGVDRIVASTEPKAHQTAQAIAAKLGVPVTRSPAFVEHQRHTAEFFDDPEQFRARVIDCMRRPDEHVFGDETATAALERFAAGVEAHIDLYMGQRLAIVSHGTVMALYTARRRRVDPVDVWKALELPDLIVL